MKKLIIFLLSMISFHSIAQQAETSGKNHNLKKDSVIINEELSFPEKCLGVWEGTMYIYNYGKLVDSVNIKFTAAHSDSADTYIWKTEYLSPIHPIVKDYKLVTANKSQGKYTLDEGDGIKLTEYCIENKLQCFFRVNDIYITSSSERIGDQLIFEVTSGKELKTKEGITNYSIINVQRVVLCKID